MDGRGIAQQHRQRRGRSIIRSQWMRRVTGLRTRSARHDRHATVQHHEPIGDDITSRIAPMATYFKNPTNGYVEKVTVEWMWLRLCLGMDSRPARQLMRRLQQTHYHELPPRFLLAQHSVHASAAGRSN